MISRHTIATHAHQEFQKNFHKCKFHYGRFPGQICQSNGHLNLLVERRSKLIVIRSKLNAITEQ